MAARARLEGAPMDCELIQVDLQSINQPVPRALNMSARTDPIHLVVTHRARSSHASRRP